MKRVALVLVASAAGVAVLATAGAATASPAIDGRAGHGRSHHRLLSPEQRRTLRDTGHVEIVRHTRKRGDVTLEVQRGMISSLTGTAITVLSKSGYSHTYVLTPTTTVRDRGRSESLSALSRRERVMVVAVHGPTGDIVRRISCIRVPVSAPAPASPSTSTS